VAKVRSVPRFGTAAALEDAKAALGWIRQYGAHLGARPGRPVVWGESDGGPIAALVALTAGEPRWQVGFEDDDTFVRGALLFYPASDAPEDCEEVSAPHGILEQVVARRPVRALLGGLDRAIDPLRCEVRDTPPVLLVQGTADPKVPRGMARRLARRIEDAGGEVHLLEVLGMPHGFDIVPSPAQDVVFQHVLGFLDGLEYSRSVRRGRPRRSPVDSSGALLRI
jgi:acetyl esterase/lipase